MSFTISTPIIWELLAVALGLIYVTLAAQHNRWAWAAAFISTAIYSVIFWYDALPMQASLNLYYMIIAIYGWFEWKKNKESTTRSLAIQRMSPKEHLVFIGIGSIGTIVIGYVLTQLALSQAPYLDTATTLFSMLNTWLMLRNRLENWLYWIMIDMINIWLFLSTEHYTTLILFSTYILLSIYGYVNWRKQITQTH